MVYSLLASIFIHGLYQQLPPPTLNQSQASSFARVALVTIYGEITGNALVISPDIRLGAQDGTNGSYRFRATLPPGQGDDDIALEVDAYCGELRFLNVYDSAPSFLHVSDALGPSGWSEAQSKAIQCMQGSDSLLLMGGHSLLEVNSTPTGYTAFYSRFRNGFRLPDDSKVSVNFDDITNQISGMSFGPTPDLAPLSTPINVTLQQARDLAALRASTFGACVESTDYPVGLAWYFEEEHITPSPPPSYLWLCKNARPKLGYVGLYEYGYPDNYLLAWIIVDPDTGAIFDHVLDLRGGVFGEHGKGKRVPMRWDWEPGPIRMINGKQSETNPRGEIALARPNRKPIAESEVILQRGRLSVWCKVDRKAGLIWHLQNGKPIYGRPDSRTMRAISRISVKRIVLPVKKGIGAKSPGSRVPSVK